MEQLGQSYQGKLGSAGYKREHAFAEEACAESYSIQASDQFVAFPYFYAGGQVLFVHSDVSFNHFLSQPGSFLFDAELEQVRITCSNAWLKVTLYLSLVHQRAHGMGDVDLVRKDDETLQRPPPLDQFFRGRRTRKDAVGVRQDKAVNGQVTANSQQAVGVSPVRVRKSQSYPSVENHGIEIIGEYSVDCFRLLP